MEKYIFIVLCIVLAAVLVDIILSALKLSGKSERALLSGLEELEKKLAERIVSLEETEKKNADKLESLENSVSENEKNLAVQTEYLKNLLAMTGKTAGREELQNGFNKLSENLSVTREELVRNQLSQEKNLINNQLAQEKALLNNQLNQQKELFETLEKQNEKTLKTVGEALDNIRKGNESKLEEMRQTVDEKLSKTLGDSLNNSFRAVTEQLNRVYNSLGEMKGLADDVGHLQKALNNVKTRGTFGEVQLGSILEQTLAPGQYEDNYSPRNNSERVEYAVKIPSKEKNGETVYLPIDAKFPQEDYLRIQDAAEQGDKTALDAAVKGLARNIKDSARKINSLYIEVPRTTAFAVMFLPTEGLYAEVLRIPGLVEDLQRQWNIMVCGPTTITAFLNTLSVGFRTIAIDRQADNIMQLLSATKTQYEAFCRKIEEARRKIDKAGEAIDDVGKCAVRINKKLKGVDVIDTAEASARLELDATYIETEENQ